MIAAQIGRLSDDFGYQFCPYDDFFATIAHFNILSERDARCFYILTDLQPGVYLFILFSCMLRVLRNFVVSASLQYKKEKESTMINFHHHYGRKAQGTNSKETIDEYVESSDEDNMDLKRIREKCLMKHKVQFTDKFSWLLKSIDTTDHSASSSKMGDQSSIGTRSSDDASEMGNTENY